MVVGLGRSGTSAARLLNAEGCRVIVIEENQCPDLSPIASKLSQEGIDVRLGTPLTKTSFSKLTCEIERIVISPGVAWNHPTLKAFRERGIPVEGELALAWTRLKKLPWIGITGTNGKTTVTHLLSHVLEKNGKSAPMGGNVGRAATDLAREYLENCKFLPDWLVMELSSYQIEAAPTISPHIGIWTNLTKDHLERHGDLDTYRKIKRSLLDQSKIRIFNGDDPDLKDQRSSLKKGLWTSAEGLPGTKERPFHFWINENEVVMEKKRPLFDSSCLRMAGKHNLQNLLLVTAAARYIGIEPKAIQDSIKSFDGIPHRLEAIGDFQGIKIFNDSKATNYEAAIAGLNSIPNPAITIAGGQIKRGEPSAWLQKLCDTSCGVVLFGEGATELKNLIVNSKFSGELRCCLQLDESVKLALKLGIKMKARSIILSPACASFDQYQNFEDRGKHFKDLIAEHINN